VSRFGFRLAYAAALERGIAMVAQEVSLVPQRTVAENVFLGTSPRLRLRRRGSCSSVRAARRRRRLRGPGGRDRRALPLAKQQQVEILRALARDAELIVFDEPTAALSATEVQRFHEIVAASPRQRRTVDPRLALPRRGPRARRHGHDPARRPVVETGRPPTRRRTRSSRRCSAARSAHLPAEAGRRRRRARRPAVRDLTPPASPARRSRSGRARSSASPGSWAPALGAGPGDLRRGPVTRRRDARGSARSPARRSARSRRGHDDPESRKDDGLHAPPAGPREREPRQPAPLGRFGFVRAPEPDAREAALRRVAAASEPRDAAGGAVGRQPAEAPVRRGRCSPHPRCCIADEPHRGVDVGAKRDLYELIVELAAGGVAILLDLERDRGGPGLAHRSS
jgi:simple sugar transport system ATP-binding protein/ribose transport system ATP-binding protein